MNIELEEIIERTREKTRSEQDYEIMVRLVGKEQTEEVLRLTENHYRRFHGFEDPDCHHDAEKFLREEMALIEGSR